MLALNLTTNYQKMIKPERPTKPQPPKETITDFITIHEFPEDANSSLSIQEIIDECPADISLNEIYLSAYHDLWWDGCSFHVKIGYEKEIPNPKLKQQTKSYNKKLEKYKKKYQEWKVKHKEWKEWKEKQKKMNRLQKKLSSMNEEELEKLIDSMEDS